ncbi:BaeS Signal transduction histidine kinase [Candidatus Nanopelagicaceae bacterium]
MSPDKAQQQLRAIAKFQVTKGQFVLALIAIVGILGLGFSSFIASSSTVKQAKILSDVETPAASIIFTQRESLVYATRLAQWANGGTTRREVQIARNILAQRLVVIDTSGRSMGSRAQASYWDALRKSDQIVASAPIGVLPESIHMKFSAEVAPVVDRILAESRRLVVSYQRSVDKEMVDAAQKTASRDHLNLIFFYIFLMAGGLFLFLNVRTNFANYRLARVALDEEQRRLDETIAELKRTQSTVAELQDLDQTKNAFMSTVNHELRTPLTSIIGYLDVIRDENMVEGNSALITYLDVLDRNAKILLHLVESMLSLSKIDAASGKLSSDRVCINEIIDNAIFVMKPANERTAISVSFKASEELFVQGDAEQLNQVFINLLGNAIKFSPPQTSINITLDTRKDPSGQEYARVAIADQGIGIPEEDLEHLFTRFFRAKNADSGQYPGTGLGLAIVSQVLQRHNGLTHLTSEVGHGTTFTVEIPLYLSGEERMILQRRGDVLRRSIEQLERATPESIRAVTHEIGGAIGFYQFEKLGREIVDYSRSRGDEVVPLHDFAVEKNRLLQNMKRELERVDGGENG